MLAILNILTPARHAVVCLAICLMANTVLGQNAQQPSRKYTPVRKAPPTVHVPDAGARPLTGARNQTGQFRDSNLRQTSYTFNDGNVKVPKILAGDKSLMPTSQALQAMQNERARQGENNMPPGISQATMQATGGFSSAPQRGAQAPTQSQSAQNTPAARTASADNQFASPGQPPQNNWQPPALPKSTGPRVAPEEINQVQPRVQKPLSAAARQAEKPETAAQGFNPTKGFAGTSSSTPQANQGRSTVDSLEAIEQELRQRRQVRESASEQPNPVASNAFNNGATMPNLAKPTTDRALNQLPGNRMEAGAETRPLRNNLANQEGSRKIPNLRSNPGQAQQPIAQATDLGVTNGAQGVRTVSNETMVSDKPQLSLRAPAIQVDTYGPRTIGVNKTGTYKVVIHNQSNFAAEDLMIGVSLPSWVQIQNMNLTAGTRAVSNNDGTNLLSWTVASIPPNSSHTMTVDATPQKAEMFDIGIEWAMVPKKASANVDVTEPKLQMKISGPNEVLYGDTAVYDVTVANPGTGTAQNVVVKLPEALGGERAKLYDILPGQEKKFHVELLARTAGKIDLNTSATAEGGLQTAAGRKIMVKRAQLKVDVAGPGRKYAGTRGQYTVTVSNEGDAMARDVVAGFALPPGVKYLGGIESVNQIENGVRWSVGALESGEKRTYQLNCQLNADGNLSIEVGVRGEGDLSASHSMMTAVETVADLVLTVEDPKGPLPTGEEIEYKIRIRNRGSRAAQEINLIMQFSQGIQPTKAVGQEYEINQEHGQVAFSPITQLNPGQELEFVVKAVADSAGSHIFQAHLICDDSESQEIAQGTTKFFGEQIQSRSATANQQNTIPPINNNQFKR